MKPFSTPSAAIVLAAGLSLTSPALAMSDDPAPANAAGVRSASLAGEWAGRYFYAANNSVPFDLSLKEQGGKLVGRSTEPNTFGQPSAKNLYGNFTCTQSGPVLDCLKVYDGTGGVNHSVKYRGTLGDDGKTIKGNWSIGATTGAFVLQRQR